MYNEIVNEQVKIIHKDGDRTEVSIGILLSYDEDVKTLKIEKSSGKIVYISALAIDKLEVLN